MRAGSALTSNGVIFLSLNLPNLSRFLPWTHLRQKNAAND